MLQLCGHPGPHKSDYKGTSSYCHRPSALDLSRINQRISNKAPPRGGSVTLISFDSVVIESSHTFRAECFVPLRPSCFQVACNVAGLSARLKKATYSA